LRKQATFLCNHNLRHNKKLKDLEGIAVQTVCK
jgi:hypothetical protein